MGLGKMEDIFQAFERFGSFRGDYLMSLYDYNLAVAQLDKSSGAFRRNLPPDGKPEKDVTPGRGRSARERHGPGQDQIGWPPLPFHAKPIRAGPRACPFLSKTVF